MKKLSLLPILLLFLTSCLIVGRGAESTPEPIPPTQTSTTDRAIFKDGLVPEYQAVLNELPYASMYEIEFNIADDLAHISGSETVIYTNAEEIDLNEVKLRLFANILGGETKVDNVTVNGEEVTPTYALNDSLMTVPLESPLKPRESLTLSMDFNLAVPQTVELNYGVQAYYDDVLALAHAYPVIVVYDDEGWNAEIPPQSGDVTYADMSFFEVTVEAPKGVTLVGSGREVNRQENGNRQTVEYAAGPVRDFYLAASSEYEVFTKKSNGIELRFYTRDYLQDGAESALETAAHAIEVFEKHYAPYPYTELDFVSTPTHALGIEYPGMIAIAEWIVSPDQNYLEATVAHEVGHQWFYNLVGNDQLDDPWLDESLTQFATLQYFSDMYGKAGAQGFRSSLEGRWWYVENEKIPVGLPVRDYSDEEYSAIVYGRGGLFFEALRDEMGSEVFNEFMKDYTQSNAWDIATPEKLKADAEEHCGCDLTDLFKKWIYP
ncbi:MAG: M1 family metallopeptidase [Chloroflexi bacterium]|nr:M1 family metallopeptidase [Chloroflexota bacterium]